MRGKRPIRIIPITIDVAPAEFAAAAPAPLTNVAPPAPPARPEYVDAAPSRRCGERLFAIRNANRVTQRDLSNASGMPVGRISAIEHGAVPTSMEVDVLVAGFVRIARERPIRIITRTNIVGLEG